MSYELPPLDKPLVSIGTKSPGNPLEGILSAIAAEQPLMKNVQPVRYAAAEWITE